MLRIFTIYFLITNLQAMESENFKVYYYPEDSISARWTIRFLESYKKKIDSTTGGNPRRPYVFIEDIGTLSNGYSDPVSGTIAIYNYVPTTDFHNDAMKSWFRTVSVHEYTHHSIMTNVKGPVRYLRPIIGKFFLPNALYLASHMQEGIAVLMESSIDRYEGRLNEGFFDAYIRLLSSRNMIRPSPYINHCPPEYPHGALKYIIGSEFTEYMFDNYGVHMVSKYYSTIAAMPVTIPLIDIPGILVFRKPVSFIYRNWKNDLKDALSPTPAKSNYLDKGFKIKYLEIKGDRLYYVKEELKRLSWEYTYAESELYEMDLKTLKKSILYTGHISLPPKKDVNSLYVGITEPEIGKENISFLGIQYLNTIMRIRDGKVDKVVSGRIRAFDVQNDTIFYVTDEPTGCAIHLFNGKNDSTLMYIDSSKVQEIMVDGETIFLTCLEPLRGTNIYRINNEMELEKLTDFPFTIASLSRYEGKLIFSANYMNKWAIYEFDPTSSRFRIFDSEPLAFYPVAYDSILYYVTIEVDGELLQQTHMNNLRDASITSELCTTSEAYEQYTVRRSTSYDFIKEMLWHDAIYPSVSVDLDAKKINLTGIQIIGHTPLNLVEYFVFLNHDELRKSELSLYYNGIPVTTVAFNISPHLVQNGIGIGHILQIAGHSYLRQTNIYFETYPFKRSISVSTTLRTHIYPSIDQYHNIAIASDSSSHSLSFDHITYIPMRKKFLLTGSMGIKYSIESSTLEGDLGARCTVPLFKVYCGNDAIIHFFYERNFLTLEWISDFQHATREHGIILTLDHLCSFLSGDFKFALRTGVMSSIPFEAVKLYLSVEPASIEFSNKLIKRRWRLREFLGMPNLI